MDSLILLIDMAVTLSGNMEESTLEKKREAIIAQNDVVRKIPKEIYNLQTMVEKMKEEMKDAEIEKNFEKFPDRSTQGLEGNKLRDALFNRGQRIRILLTFYINKLAGGKTKPRSKNLKKAKRYYENEPDAALNDLIKENGKDIHSLKAVLGLYSDSEIKQIQRRKKFGIGGRKSRKKRGKGLVSSKMRRKKHISARQPKQKYVYKAREILANDRTFLNADMVVQAQRERNLALELQDNDKKGGRRKRKSRRKPKRRKTKKRKKSKRRKSRRKRR